MQSKQKRIEMLITNSIELNILQKLYSISEEDLKNLKAKQNNSCAICFKENTKLCIDHDHKTNKVRGLLCTQCNTGIGFLRDDIQILNSAINYLKTQKK